MHRLAFLLLITVTSLMVAILSRAVVFAQTEPSISANPFVGVSEPAPIFNRRTG